MKTRKNLSRGLAGIRSASVVLSISVVIAFLWPTLVTPYLGDDAFNSSIDAWRQYEHLSWPEAYRQILQWHFMAGRFYPLYPLILIFDFATIHSLIILKSIVLIAIVANVITLYILLRLVAPSIAEVSVAILPATLQIRYFHDALIQFSLHMQVVLEFILLAAVGIAASASTRKKSYLVFSIICFSLAALTYEASYAFVFGLLLLAIMLLRGRQRVLAASSLLMIPLACCAAVMVVRTFYPTPSSSQYAIHADLLAIMKTWMIQILGSVPLSYSFFDPGRFLPSFYNLLIPNRSNFLIVCISFSSILVSLAIVGKFYSEVCAKRISIIAPFAVLMTLSSGSMISLSNRWQHELRPGLAYTPTYFAYFFVTILIAIGIVWLNRRRSRVISIAVALLFAVATSATYRANQISIARYAGWSMIMPNALDDGILASTRNDETIYVDDSYPALQQFFPGSSWDVRYFIFAHAHRRLSVRRLSSLLKNPPTDGSRAIALVGKTADFNNGRVVSGQLRMNESGRNSNLVSMWRSYVEKNGHAEMLISNPACLPIPLDNVLSGTFSGIDVEYGDTFFMPENDGEIPFRWASGSSRILLRNATASKRSGSFSMTIRAANYPSTINISADRFSLRRNLVEDLSISVPFSIDRFSSSRVSVDSHGSPVSGNPGGRHLQFEVRDAQVDEPTCRPLRES